MKKIQTKIMMMVAIAIVGVTVVSVLLSKEITYKSTISALEQNLQETARLAATSAEHMIATYTGTVSEIASNPTLTDNKITSEKKQEFIQTKVDTYYMRFGGIADTNGYDPIHDVDISKEPFFQAAMNGESYLSAPYIDGNDMYLFVSAPVMKNGKVDSVIYFQCDTYILQSIIEDIKIGEQGEAYILDKEGTTIAYWDEQSVLNKENAIQNARRNPNDKDAQAVAAIERKMIAGESGVEEFYYEKDDSNNIQAYTPIHGTDGWSVAIVVDTDEFLRSAYTGNTIQTAVCLGLCVIVILVSFGVSHSIASPVVQCAKRLQQLSEGDLKSSVPVVNGRDETRVLSDATAQLVNNFNMVVNEIGSVLGGIANGDLSKESKTDNFPGDFRILQDYLRTINDNLNHTLGGIATATTRISNDSVQVASSSATLSRGAVEQASAVEQLSSIIGNMDSDSKETAKLAEHTKDMVDSAGAQLNESNERIQELNEAMNLITTTSDEIARIIGVIENISAHTNILALNAAIEAAHAGMAGRGFAIVAEEVRNLASQSDQAAKATRELIEHAIEAVNSGSVVVEKVTESVSEVVILAGQAADQMGVVADAVEQQTKAIEQASIGIHQISDVVQDNSGMAQESANVSEELSEQASVLKHLVGSFTLR
ncbi:MAG: HAMP domain-containing protein [Lachnospiraceae bacterium]|nr:HAMP domain-containing protein [Lachnospiraceae bacterium]